jgi:hypothetical protein
MAGAIFRVEAQERDSGVLHTVYVRAASASAAMAHVNRGNMIVRAVHRAEESEIGPGTGVQQADSAGPSRAGRVGESALLTRPVVTIAGGVFLGMALFAIASAIVGALFTR